VPRCFKRPVLWRNQVAIG
jgi:hypothetical protein